MQYVAFQTLREGEVIGDKVGDVAVHIGAGSWQWHGQTRPR